MDTPEKYILIIAYRSDEDAAEASLDELGRLIETAGGEPVGMFSQKLDHPDPATYIGSGKALELKEMMEVLEADAVVCDDELTPAQHRNLSDILDAKVIDRTMLILDIFASHAHTGEGKLQVEMAQLKYRSSHLKGAGIAMSRLGGGIGTRGPGETKLETDRRLIGRKIARLSSDLKELQNNRMTMRKRRMSSQLNTVAIVGYTNAGKSTLLNYLTSSDVLSEDKLFATLDPTTRKCILPNGSEILFTDTVGFINKLPHQLIDAFKSTLEEARYADIILHVVDMSDPEADMHMQVVYDTLAELGVTGKPVITAFNKCDVAEPDAESHDPLADRVVSISAGTGEHMDDLYDAIEAVLTAGLEPVDEVIPYTEASRLAYIRKYGRLTEEEYTEDGIRVKGYIMPGHRTGKE